MGNEAAPSDPLIYDLSVELAAVAGRLVTAYAAKGLEITRDEVVASVLDALERDRLGVPDGVASLGKARVARGLPAMARPVQTEASESLECLNIAFTFEGARATEIGRMAMQLYGDVSPSTCQRVVTSATERGIASLKRELKID